MKTYSSLILSGVLLMLSPDRSNAGPVTNTSAPQSADPAIVSSLQAAIAPNEILNTMTAGQVFLKFMLAASGESDEQKLVEFDRATAWLRAYYNTPVRDIRIDTPADLAEFRERIRFESYTLDEELAERSSTSPPTRWNVLTTSPEVIAELNRIKDHFSVRAQEMSRSRSDAHDLANLVAQNAGNMSGDLKSLAPFLISLGINADLEALARESGSEQTKLSIVNGFETAFESAIGEIRGVGARLTASSGIALPSRTLQVFLTTIISEYYRRIPRFMIKNMLSDLIDAPEKTSILDRFEVMVLNSGVQFQKLFQVYARQEGFPEELKAIFKRLEKNTKSVPWRIVERIVRSHKVAFEWRKIERKPLAKATINQVHSAEIMRKGQKTPDQVVIRMIKPGSIESIRTDNRILGEVATVLDSHPELVAANFPKLAPFVGDLQEMAMIDTNLPKTTRHQQKAFKLYTRDVLTENGRTVRIRVPRVFPLQDDASMMVIERINGMGFDDFIEQNPESARIGAEAFMRTWLELSFDLKNSLLHADAHLGNIMANETDGVITMYLLDFGMVSSLPFRMQGKVMGLSIIARTHDPVFISRALWNLSVKSQNGITRSELDQRVREKIKSLSASGVGAWPITEWLAFASNNGLRLPYSLSYFNRGFLTTARLIKTVESDLRTPAEMKKIMLKHPIQMIMVLLSSSEFSLFEWFRIFWSAATNKVDSQTMPGYVTGTDDTTETRPADGQPPGRCELLFNARH